MPNDTQGQIEAEGKQAVAMPTTDKPTEAPIAPQGSLPEDATERTKAEFAKLLERNRAMAEELDRLKKPAVPLPTSVLDEFQRDMGTVEGLPPAQVTAPQPSTTDQDEYVDVNALNRALEENARIAKEAAERARKAEERIAKYEQSSEEQRTHKEHPYLDPYNPNFDKKFYELVRLKVREQRQLGQQDYLGAANYVKANYYDPATVTSQKAAQEQVQQQAQQEQRAEASNEAATPRSSYEGATHEELVKGTYNGDTDAIYKRLQASGH